MGTLGHRPAEMEQLQHRLAQVEQECELLQAALEDADEETQKLTEENLQLRLQLAQSQSRLLEARTAAHRPVPHPAGGWAEDVGILSEELNVSLEELQATAEELA